MTTIAQAASFRPRGMGELLDQSLRLYRANFLKFIGIIALVEIPVGLLQLLSSTLMLNGLSTMQSSVSTDTGMPGIGALLGGAGATMLLSAFSVVLVGGIGTAALTRAIADGYMGEPVEILGSYRKIGRSWISLIGALLLFVLVGIGAAIWTVVPCVGWLTGPGILFFLTLAVSPLLGPIIVLEKVSAATAVRRAWDLARARFWWIIGYVGILYLFNMVVISGPIALINALVFVPLQRQAAMTGAASQALLMTTAAQQIISVLLGTLYRSLQATAITMAYFDLRTRLEGFDLAVQTLSPEQSIVEQLSQTPTSQGKPGLITRKDVLHVFLLSLIGAGFYAVLMGILMAFGIWANGLGGLP